MVSGKWDKYKTLLTILFLLAFLSRLYFAFQTPHFSNDSYYTLRHIEHITEAGLPLFHDPLSYGGRTYYFPPLFHYMMAGTAMLLPLQIAAKIIPSLLFSILIILVYGISYKLTGHKGYSFLASLFFSFTPISYVFPINDVSPYHLAVPLFFRIIYAMMNMKENLNIMLLLIVGIVFTHPSAFLLVIGLLFFLLLLKLEGLEVEKESMEIVLFTVFLVFWTLFILYKNVFLEQGIGAIWQNLPDTLIAAAFPELNILQVVFFVGMVPLFLGMIGVYDSVFRKADRNQLLLLGFTLSVFFLLLFNFVRLRTGLLYLSVLLSILAAQGLKARADYMKKTRFAWAKKYLIFFLILFFLISSVIPLYGSALNEARDVPSQGEIEALEWIRNNTARDATVLTPLSEGHTVTYFADRKNVMDTNFLLINDVNQRFRDLSRSFTVRLKAEALRSLTKYDVDYIYFSPVARDNYGVEKLYYTDGRCFEKVFDEEVDIYSVRCEYHEVVG